MAEETAKKNTRRLRQATETMRERAEKTANEKQPRRKRLGIPFRRVFGVIGRIPIWKPFRFVGRMAVRFLIPPYIKRSFVELRLVDWPSRKQTRQLTLAVILFSVTFGLIVSVVDFGLDRLFKQVIIK